MRPKDPQHMYMNTTGQSGNPLSRHYSDMVTPFRDVLYFHLPSAAGEDADGAHLELVPRQAR
jgi:penicillin amidase